MATKKVTLQFYGWEYEWEGLKESGENEWCSGLFYTSIDEIELFVDDEELTDEEALEHLDRTVKQRTINNDWEDVVGIREWYNKACYTCEIEVQDTFDPMKLSLNAVANEFTVKDDKFVADGIILSSITYDGKVYDFDDTDATGRGSELVWGYDPEDEDEDEDSYELEEDSVEARLRREYDEVYKEDGIFVIEKDEKYGLADADGNELIPPRYDWLGEGFYDGLCVAGYRGENHGVGYINLKGEEVITPKQWSVSDFNNGIAKVSYDGKRWGYINTNGEIIVPPKYVKLLKCVEVRKIVAFVDDGDIPTAFYDFEGNIIEP